MSVFFSCSKSSHPLQEVKCERSDSFEIDLAKGIVKVYEAGPRGYGNTYQRLMMERYNVEIIKTDLFVLYPEMTCYNQFSIPYVKENYGGTVFFDTKKEAYKLDTSGLGDRPPTFITPIDSFQRYFETVIAPEHYADHISWRGYAEVHCSMYFDSTGKATSVKTNYRSSMQQAFEQAIKTLPYRVSPALDDGKPALGSLYLSFRFSEESMKLYRSANTN